MPPKRRQRSHKVCNAESDSDFDVSKNETADILHSLNTSDIKARPLQNFHSKQQNSDTKRRKVTADTE
jgi:hypothetical protein